MTLRKTQQVKVLFIAALFLCVLHLWISFHRAAPGNRGTNTEWMSSSKSGMPIGVSGESLKEYTAFDRAIDSLLAEDYGLLPARIKNDPVQYDNRIYNRKVVQVHPDFPVTLFNTDLKEYADRFGWEIYNVQESLKTGDLTADIGRDSRIYEHLQLMVNRKLAAESKSLSILVSGFGLTYDDMTRAFIGIPESITLVVPKGQEYSKIITHEARRAGKAVIPRIPDLKTIIRFEAADLYDSAMAGEFYTTLRKAPDRSLILFYEKKSVLDLLTAELPKLPKKGYRIVQYSR